MALKRKGNHWYGDEQADIRAELVRYSEGNYPAEHFADALCTCGGQTFALAVDDNEGAAIRTCSACSASHPMGDSAEFIDDAVLEDCECPCGGKTFEITVGVALHPQQNAVKWLYIGCRCPRCRITACYAEWKNEFEDYRELLKLV